MDAEVTVNGADGASMTELMMLGAGQGNRAARGSQRPGCRQGRRLSGRPDQVGLRGALAVVPGKARPSRGPGRSGCPAGYPAAWAGAGRGPVQGRAVRPRSGPGSCGPIQGCAVRPRSGPGDPAAGHRQEQRPGGLRGQAASRRRLSQDHAQDVEKYRAGHPLTPAQRGSTWSGQGPQTRTDPAADVLRVHRNATFAMRLFRLPKAGRIEHHSG